MTCALSQTYSSGSTSAPGGVDGWVSLELSPTIAYDAKAVAAEALRLHAEADRPNLFIKTPGTARRNCRDRRDDLQQRPGKHQPLVLLPAVP